MIIIGIIITGSAKLAPALELRSNFFHINIFNLFRFYWHKFNILNYITKLITFSHNYDLR